MDDQPGDAPTPASKGPRTAAGGPDRAPTDREPGEISPWSLAGLGLQLAVSLWIFVVAGQWLDRRLGTAPVFLLTGVFAGAGGTFVLSLRRLLRRHEPRSSDRSRSA